MKNGSAGSDSARSTPAVRHWRIRPSGRVRDPLPTARSSRYATTSIAAVRTAQPNGWITPGGTAATQRPKALPSARSRSTTAISSRYASPMGTIRLAVPHSGCRPPSTDAKPYRSSRTHRACPRGQTQQSARDRVRASRRPDAPRTGSLQNGSGDHVSASTSFHCRTVHFVTRPLITYGSLRANSSAVAGLSPANTSKARSYGSANAAASSSFTAFVRSASQLEVLRPQCRTTLEIVVPTNSYSSTHRMTNR